MGKEHCIQIIDLVDNDNNKQTDNYKESNQFSKYNNNENEEDGDDDDCILVEPQVDCITIDDEISPYTNSTPIKKNIAKKRRLNTGGPTQPQQHKISRNELYIEDTKGGNKMNYPLPYYNRKSTLMEENFKCELKSNSHQTIANNVSNEIIILDDTIAEERDISKEASSILNDSVECVEETRLDDFIPLISTKPLQPVQNKNENAKLPNRKPHKPRNSLFTESELRQLNVYNSNAYNPNANQAPASSKRMIIIDGSNVAFSHHLNKGFSVKGIKIAIEYFERLGHEVKAVIPRYRLQNLKSSDPKELNRLHNNGKIVLTPCKKLDGKSATSYDDRFILQLACELDGVVLSNDNYRDLVHENLALKKIIENRVVGYTWCNDVFILPKDPYGKWGPPLSAILNRH